MIILSKWIGLFISEHKFLDAKLVFAFLLELQLN